MALSLDLANATFLKIMGNGQRYVVPRFQRDYSWEVEQWEELWNDIVDESEKGEQHYMGYLVLQNADDNQLIIDGQQRITTVTILILAALNILKRFIAEKNEPDENSIRLQELKSTYIGFTDPVSLMILPKLTLNKNNNAHFRKLCALEKPLSRKIKKSEKALTRALDFFIEKIDQAKISSGKEIAEFIRVVATKLLFTTITVSDDVQSYKIFETLNARGVKLSVPDLIKNYLFSLIDKQQELHDSALSILEDDWEAVTNQLEDLDFSKFLQAEWNSRNPLVQKNHLFKKIKNSVNTGEKASAYLQNLTIASEVFAALNNPEDNFWERDEYKKIRSSLRVFDMFNIVQPQVVLMAAHQHYAPEEFVKIARYLEVVSIRYNVIGRLQPNVQEGIYNTLAQKISRKEVHNLNAIKSELKPLYLEDEEFENYFISKSMATEHSTKKVRFLLARIEEHISGQKLQGDGDLTVEHILPKNPSEDWDSYFTQAEMDDLTNRIGNLTLLQTHKNKELNNQSFAQKKTVYADSKIHITKECAEYDVWDKEAIEKRQKWLAEKAVDCWKIEFINA